MIVEHRMYTLHVGKVAEYMKIYQDEGLAIQSRILGAPVGWYYTEIGTINRIIHMWMYEDLNDRRDRRAKMAADAGWQAYLQKIQPLIITQESMILNPAPFFTPKR
jgi:hypothetical protein